MAKSFELERPLTRFEMGSNHDWQLHLRPIDQRDYVIRLNRSTDFDFASGVRRSDIQGHPGGTPTQPDESILKGRPVIVQFCPGLLKETNGPCI